MAQGITETTNNGLFQNEIEFHGHFADHIQFLKDLKIFPTIREGYIMCAVIGFKYNQFIDDEPIGNKKVSIFTEQVLSKKDILSFIYRIIMLTYETKGFKDTDYTNRAFRDDYDMSQNENLKKNMKIFNSFVLGGLEFLYDKFKDFTFETDRSEVIDLIYELVSQFNPKNQEEQIDIVTLFK